MNDSQQRRPAFAKAFPPEPSLDALVESFSRGNYADVRASGQRLLDSTQDPAIREAARTLIERTSPDRLTKTLLALAAVLLTTLSAWWITHGKSPSLPPPHVEHVR